MRWEVVNRVLCDWRFVERVLCYGRYVESVVRLEICWESVV